MTITASRRAVLAGAAALPALSVPAVAGTQPPDPIFAAIERHKAAFLRMHETGQVTGNLRDDDERIEAASAAEEEAIAAFDDASHDLLDLARTASPAAIVALLGYAEAFNRKAFSHDRDYGASGPFHWAIIEQFEFEDDNHHGGASFAWALLDSIRENLASRAV